MGKTSCTTDCAKRFTKDSFIHCVSDDPVNMYMYDSIHIKPGEPLGALAMTAPLKT